MMSLKPAAYSHGPVIFNQSLDSTNLTAKKLADSGTVDGTVVLCDEQSSGRGRQGRDWQATPGLDLTFSAVVRNLSDRMSLLPVAAAVAVCESCDDVAGTDTRIKWPNDVWIGRNKVAGILIEAKPRGDWAVVGVGLNVNSQKEHFPESLRDQATSLLIKTDNEVERETLLRSFLECLDKHVEELRDGTTAHLLRFYRSRDVLRGLTIGWEAGGSEHRGRAEGIDDSGNLIVSTRDGQATLSAGEVHLVDV